ncbi:MAG: DUF3047 domain-containing protein [Chitinophagaceae bacterium]|nr:DUF3047 domain-containing protein [Rubrivivax sp.]
MSGRAFAHGRHVARTAVAVVACGLCALAAAEFAAAPDPLVTVRGEEAALGAGWHVVTLPKQKPPVTRYVAERVDGRLALRVEAQRSYGNLVHTLSGAPPRELRWAWRLEQGNPAIDLRRKDGDDSPVKICLSFDLSLDKVPFFERELLRLARSRSTQPLPAATLCWVWGHGETVGAMLRNVYTPRVRYIVLRGAADALGRWAEEKRDVEADFRRAFGDELGDREALPTVTAVIVAGDADNTGGQSLAFVADLSLSP